MTSRLLSRVVSGDSWAEEMGRASSNQAHTNLAGLAEMWRRACRLPASDLVRVDRALVVFLGLAD